MSIPAFNIGRRESADFCGTVPAAATSTTAAKCRQMWKAHLRKPRVNRIWDDKRVQKAMKCRGRRGYGMQDFCGRETERVWRATLLLTPARSSDSDLVDVGFLDTEPHVHSTA